MQRISGMGLGLIAGPVLAVTMGPVEGILVVNVLAFFNAAATTATVREYVDWRKFAVIASVLVVGAVAQEHHEGAPRAGGIQEERVVDST